MDAWLCGLCLCVGGLALVQALLVVVQTWEHHRFARSRLSLKARYPHKGLALVVAPCKGVDVGLEGNLRSLFRQDYRNYCIRFVIQSADDPAFAVIQRVMADHPEVPCELLIAGEAYGEGQKIHNLRVATSDLPTEVKYLAFVDSDARVRRQWLRALVARLDRPEVGAATGYRWFVPVQPTLANLLLHSINAHVAVLFGSRSPTIVWGGSWAIRRDRFEALGLPDAWAGTLSDDLVASRLLCHAGWRVIFEPACMVTSLANVSLGGLMAFLRRQYMMGRLYVPRAWAAAALLTSVVVLAALLNAAWFAIRLVTGIGSPWLPAAMCAALYALSLLGGLLRQDLALSYFPQLHATLRKARRFEIWSGPLVALLNWVTVLSSAVGRRVVWRGIMYVVKRGGQVVAVVPDKPTQTEQQVPAFDAHPGCAGPTVLCFPSAPSARPAEPASDAAQVVQRRCA